MERLGRPRLSASGDLRGAARGACGAQKAAPDVALVTVRTLTPHAVKAHREANQRCSSYEGMHTDLPRRVR